MPIDHAEGLVMSESTPSLTGLAAVEAALKTRAAGQRSMSWLAGQLGLTRGATRHWDKVPVDYLHQISQLTGLHPRVLRPDLAEMFSPTLEGEA